MISVEAGRTPVVVYGFDPFLGKWITWNTASSEIELRFAIYGTSVATETTRQLVIIRSRKYCFWDLEHALNTACAAHAADAE